MVLGTVRSSWSQAWSLSCLTPLPEDLTEELALSGNHPWALDVADPAVEGTAGSSSGPPKPGTRPC